MDDEKIIVLGSNNVNNRHYPSYGWLFPCEVCYRVTSRTVELANKYIFYMCNTCQHSYKDRLEDELYNIILMANKDDYKYKCRKRWKHSFSYIKCNCNSFSDVKSL